MAFNWFSIERSLTAIRQLMVFTVVYVSTSEVLLPQSPHLVPVKPERAIRVATYNVSFHRSRAGELAQNLTAGNLQAARIAAVIRAVRPDILLLNEIDFSESSDNAALFAEKYLSDAKIDSLGGTAWEMPYRFSASVNTGVPSGLDLNHNQRQSDPEDAWGYGVYPGQYGMAVLSRFEIPTKSARTFQKLLWSKLPGALKPQAPGATQPYYAESTWTELRLPSKSFWDVPISTPLGTIRMLACHPTPPAFDGPEDRNGCRNHDEIRLLSDYINGINADYFVDDQGVAGALGEDQLFAVLGDLNSDPVDGDSHQSAIRALLANTRISPSEEPRSPGGAESAAAQKGANRSQKGDPSSDTADFSDSTVGNLRVDYVLPSKQFQVVASGVFWPSLGELAEPIRTAVRDVLAASDHRLVWVDIALIKSH